MTVHILSEATRGPEDLTEHRATESILLRRYIGSSLSLQKEQLVPDGFYLLAQKGKGIERYLPGIIQELKVETELVIQRKRPGYEGIPRFPIDIIDPSDAPASLICQFPGPDGKRCLHLLGDILRYKCYLEKDIIREFVDRGLVYDLAVRGKHGAGSHRHLLGISPGLEVVQTNRSGKQNTQRLVVNALDHAISKRPVARGLRETHIKDVTTKGLGLLSEHVVAFYACAESECAALVRLKECAFKVKPH